MKSYSSFFLILVGSSLLAMAADPPKGWIDPDTGHRVVRLSNEPNSASLYFNQNAYTADGNHVIITTRHGLSTIDLKTGAIESIVEGRVGVIVAGRKTGQVYYTKEGAIFATDVNTKATRKIATLSFRGSLATLNADETLLAGATTEGAQGVAIRDTRQPAAASDGRPLNKADAKEVMLDRRLERRLPMALFTVNVKTGEVKTIYRSTDWLNHLQFSPIDPTLLMFCHEGPWHKVDRIWTIRTDGADLTKIHARTMEMEIAGHEFWSADGKTIWYDLQTPRGEDFWVAGYDVGTHGRTWYHLDRNEWSVHFNVSPDGKLFAGDGGDNEMVAHAKNGKWIYLFRPETVPNYGVKPPGGLIKVGVLKSEKLVNMAKHDYALEPNVSFTPDMKWIVFRSNMFGPTQVFAVEIEKSAAQTAGGPLKFDFGSGPAIAGFTKVLPSTTYTSGLGYGFEEGSPVKSPIYFSVKAPEGNYRITVTVGDPNAESTTTVKAELRRLMLENVHTASGEFQTRSFIVNVRTPNISGGGEVRLKPREKTLEAWAWDDKLTLEFIGTRPAVRSVEIEKVDNLPTIYLAGDSTSTDQPREPFNSWGQMLTRFFKPEIAIANHGESGESLRSFIDENRWSKLLSVVKSGDYVLIQMGHNDQKDKSEGAGAFTTYKTLLKRFIFDVRQHGAAPILVTPMHRLTFGPDDKIVNSLGDFPEAVRETAKEEKVALIDLHAMSKPFYEALGPHDAHNAFAGKDTSHHSDYGSYELAKCVVEGIRRSGLPIAGYLADGIPPFDPAHPDTFKNFDIPGEPVSPAQRPYGN